MKIVGSSKQDGTPKPDNPVQITNETVLIITDKEINKKRIGFQGSHNSISYEYWEDNYDIKSIVKKEQFASMKYKVKG